MRHRLRQPINERGAVAIEYGLLALLIATALVAAMTDLGAAIDAMYGDVTGAINALN